MILRRFTKHVTDQNWFAVGLDVIVVIVGILLAFQVESWKETRADQKLATEYLKGIQNDLSKDVALINNIIRDESAAVATMVRIEDLFSHITIDDREKFSELLKAQELDDISQLFRRGVSFRGFRGNYDSLISDGKSGLIKNRNLFGKLQAIYDEQHARLDSIYSSIKQREEHIISRYPEQKYLWNYEDLVLAKSQKIFFELTSFTELKYFYFQWLILLRIDINNTLPELEREIERLKLSQ